MELENEISCRYSVIHEKNPREIVLIRGKGCRHRRCRFCDYHLDSNPSQEENHKLNQVELEKITGIYHKLEVINSGSFGELPLETMELLEKIVVEKNIHEIHFECHWKYREEVAPLRERFKKLGTAVVVKIGVETFDWLFRECYMEKGMGNVTPQEIAEYFDECCLLQGIPGQNAESMMQDIELGLAHFQRVCVNIMQENGKAIRPHPQVIQWFVEEVYPIYKDNPRVDILLENTAFGVGGVTTNAQ